VILSKWILKMEEFPEGSFNEDMRNPSKSLPLFKNGNTVPFKYPSKSLILKKSLDNQQLFTKMTQQDMKNPSKSLKIL